MRIGLLRESKDRELRVALLPENVQWLTRHGHPVRMQSGAGEGSGLTDDQYRKAGAEVVEEPADVIAGSDLITKVKEPTAAEVAMMQPGQVVWSYLHLAADEELLRRILEAEIIALGFETVQASDGTLPILVPMSEVAGRLAVQIGAHWLQGDQGGRGVLLGGVPGVDRGRVTILGAGVVGTAAVRIAYGLGADVTVLDLDHRRLAHLYDIYHGELHTLFSNPGNLERSVTQADLVIGAVLVPGARAPVLVSREWVSRMNPGAVIVDVAVDQGGCVETTRVTSHSDPVYRVEGVLHYGVANIPGAVPRTSTFALANASFPYLQDLAERGLEEALRADPSLARGVNCWRGRVTHEEVALAQDRPYAEAPWRASRP
ncbi:MAG: alanine dehydrogenase [Myxococcota bacterium]